MKRNLVFVGDGSLAFSLGISSEREEYLRNLIDVASVDGLTIQAAFERWNEADLTDAEWTCLIYAAGKRGRVHVFPASCTRLF